MSGRDLLVYIDGNFYPESQAKISVCDHGFLYGDGVFEGIRAYGGRIFRLVEHIDRLFESAKTIGLTIPMSEEDLSEACAETLRRNGLRDGYLRLVVSRARVCTRRNPPFCIPASAKTLNYLNNVMARIEAINAGADESQSVPEKYRINAASHQRVSFELINYVSKLCRSGRLF